MDYGRLSGKLYGDEDWLGMPGAARELLVSIWSWAIDHDKEDGEVTEAVLSALSAALGNGPDSEYSSGRAIEALVLWGWMEPMEPPGESDYGGYVGSFRLLRWSDQGDLIRRARERREKERERYLRRKAAE